MIRRQFQALSIGAALIAAGSAVAQAQAVEAAPAVPGAEIVAARLLSGPFYKVAEPVKVEGHLGRFVIESKFGKFSVHGTRTLAERVSEMQAIDELQKVQKDSAFGEALSKSVKGVGNFAVSAVTEPGKTVENIGKGVGSVLGNIGHVAKSGAAYVGDKASDLTKDARPAPQGASAGDPEPPSFTGDPFGYNKARREWSKKLGIDPYTTNPVLRPLLNDAATATFAGNFAVGMTLGAVVAPLNLAYALDDTVRQSVWNKSPVDLEQENEKKLLELGVQARTIRDLFRNRWFTPTLQTGLVARLEALGKIEGVESVVRIAAATQGESRARFLVESFDLLVNHHQKDGKLTKITMVNLVPAAVAADGARVVAVAIDYGYWDRSAASFAANKAFSGQRKTLLVAGKLSARASQSLEKAGWTVKTGLRPA